MYVSYGKRGCIIILISTLRTIYIPLTANYIITFAICNYPGLLTIDFCDEIENLVSEVSLWYWFLVDPKGVRGRR